MKSGEVHTLRAKTPKEALFAVQSLCEKIKIDSSVKYVKDDGEDILYKVVEAQIIEVVSAEML